MSQVKMHDTRQEKILKQRKTEKMSASELSWKMEIPFESIQKQVGH